MHSQRFIVLTLVAVLATTFSGCSKETPAMASPACVELDMTTDVTRRAELLQKCPRAGPKFKPSPKIGY